MQLTPLCRALSLGAASLATCALGAQSFDTDTRPAGLPSPGDTQFQDWMRPATVHAQDGEILATQADWKAMFDADGVTFSPTLGAEAPRPLPVRFTYVAAGRGSDVRDPRDAAAPSPEPVLVDRTVSYARADGIRELFEVREAGLKHSVVFERRPAGSGDLRVRLALDTELAAPEGRHLQGLVFGDGNRGLVEIGAVLGIDAVGRSESGWIENGGDHLDLVLPARFVDTAAYPLTLDPLIGSLTQMGTGGARVDYSDVAYDVTTDTYLVVWQRNTASRDRDVFGQRIRPDGSLVGSRLSIDANGNDDYAPRVANVNLRDAFFVVWEFDNHYSGSGPSKEVWGRAVRAADGTMGATFRIQDAVDIPGSSIGDVEGMQPDVCGERTTADDECLVVFVQPRSLPTIPGRGIVTREITVAADLSASAIASRNLELTDNVNARNPRICNSGGSGRVAMVVWEDPSSRIGARALSMNSAFRSGAGLIPGTVPASRPSVDGNGTTFLVAYRRQEPNNSTSNDIWTIDLQLPSSNSAVLTYRRQAAFESDPNQSENDPYVALVQDGPDASRQYYAIHYKQGDPNVREDSWVGRANGLGESCGPRDLVRNFSSSSNITSMYAGGRDNDDRAMIVIYDGNYVGAQAWEAFGNGGPITDLGGRFGLGGTLRAVGAFALGNLDYRLELAGAKNGQSGTTYACFDFTSTPSTLACSAGRLILNCPVVIGLPLTNGSATMPLAVSCDPNLIGFPLSLQFVTLTPANPNCGLGLSGSNLLSMTIGR